MDFEIHICCHVHDLSHITNWQHIGEGPLWQHISNKCCLPTAPQFNSHIWCRFFSGVDKINNIWQQKQQVLFLSNMTPKCCWLKRCCWGTHIGTPQNSRMSIFGDRLFSSFDEIKYFWQQKQQMLFLSDMNLGISCQKFWMRGSPKNFMICNIII